MIEQFIYQMYPYITMKIQTYFTKRLFQDKPIHKQALIALIVLITGLILSIAGFIELQAIAKERLYLQTQQHTAAQIRQIQTNIDISLDSLTEIAVLYHAAGKLFRSQLTRYITSDLKYHSATMALGWIPVIAGHDVEEFEQTVKKFDPAFYVYEVTGHGMPIPANNHDKIYPVEFVITPDHHNITAGLNIASITSRYHVLRKAERTQQTAITQRISLYTGRHRFYGFQAFHPVFTNDNAGHKQLKGFIMGNYAINPLFEDVFGRSDLTVDVAAYDANTGNQQLLYSSTSLLSSVDDVNQSPRAHWTYTLNVADQKWIVDIFPKAPSSPSWLPYAGLIAGSFITVLLTVYLFISLVKTRQLAEMATNLAGTESLLTMQTQLKQQADQANRAKSGLLRAASHDLRQPLHTIGLLTTLLKDSQDEDERRALLDKILIAVDSMNSLFTSLLDITLLESNQLPIQIKHFYLQDILEKLQLDFALQAEEKGLAFTLVETSCCVITDPVLLERILRNILSNAIRYTPKGRVLLGCRRRKQHIRICIFDTGIGFSKEVQLKIFDTFYRDQRAKQLSDKGLGLGLAIVQHAAHLLGLNTGIESEPDKGSLFYIDVPYGNPQSIEEQQIPPALSTLHQTIWIIEDDPTTRDALTEILRAWQCHVESFASGADVQQQLNKHRARPDTIIADYQLINETGLDVLLRIRRHYRHNIPAIIITGTTDLSIRRKIEHYSCQIMIKPIKPEQLNQYLQHPKN